MDPTKTTTDRDMPFDIEWALVHRLDARGRGYLGTAAHPVSDTLYRDYFLTVQRTEPPYNNRPMLFSEDLEPYFGYLINKLMRGSSTADKIKYVGFLDQFPKSFWSEERVASVESAYWDMARKDQSSHFETWKNYVEKLLTDMTKGFRPEVDRLALVLNLIMNHPKPLDWKGISNLLPPESEPIVQPGDKKGLAPTIVSGKWAGLELARRAGVPVPDGFVLPIRTKATAENLRSGMEEIESRTGKKFGDASNPLLVSVRSGAVVSFPGEMKSVTNVGITPEVYEALKTKYGVEVAADMKLRFIHTFAEAVWGIPRENFAKFEIYETHVENLAVAEAYLYMLFGDGQLGAGIPADPYEQLKLARNGVSQSSIQFLSTRAERYGLPKISPSIFSTAVIVNEMKFGNLRDGKSGSGVAYSRHRSDGSPVMMVDYKPASQGEDVVSGAVGRTGRSKKTLSQSLSIELEERIALLEKEKKRSVEVEFVVEAGHLFITQVKDMEAPPEVRMRIAEDMEGEGLIDGHDADPITLHLPNEMMAIRESAVSQEPLAVSALTNGFMRHVTLAGRKVGDFMDEGLLFVGDAYQAVRESIRPQDAVIDGMNEGSHDFNALSKQGVAVHLSDDFEWQRNGMLRVGKNLFHPGEKLTLLPNGEIHRGHLELETVSLSEAARRVRAGVRRAPPISAASARNRGQILVARRSAALHAMR